MIHLFLNADEYMAAEQIAKIKALMGDADMADMNTAELTGAQTDAADILGQASMMPFLASKRLLIVRGYLDHLDKRVAASKDTGSAAHTEAMRLLTGVADLPETSEIIFIDAKVDKRRHLWKGFKFVDKKKESEEKIAGLADLIKQETISLTELTPPDPKQLFGWVQRRAQQKQIDIDGRAVKMLADFVGVNLRQIDNELEKLATYASGRKIVADDVKLLVSDASEALIWDLTDALSQRNGKKAMTSLYELRRSDANAFYLLTMIARQYRIMIKVKETAATVGGSEYDIAKIVKESPYPVKKAMQQSRQYSTTELDGVMDKLLRCDYAMKMGANPETEIDVLVAELTVRGKR